MVGRGAQDLWRIKDEQDGDHQLTDAKRLFKFNFTPRKKDTNFKFQSNAI